MKPERVGLVFGLLIFIIVVLAVVVIYAFVVRPAFSDYVTNKEVSAYNQGQADLLNTILLNIQQLGYVNIPIGNQSLILAPVQVSQPSAK